MSKIRCVNYARFPKFSLIITINLFFSIFVM